MRRRYCRETTERRSVIPLPSDASTAGGQPTLVSIVTSGHDVADARLHRHAAALREAGFAVEVLGLGDRDGAPDEAARVVVTARPPLWRRPLQAWSFARAAHGQVLISLDPESAFSCWARARLSRRRVVVDVHEDYRAVLKDRQWSRGFARPAGRVLADLGIFAARRADLTAVADRHLLDEVETRVVVRNVPNEVAAAKRDARPRAVYVGDVRASRGVFTMLETLRQCPTWSLDLVGPIAAADRARVESMGEELGDRVRIHGRMRPDEAWRLAAGAWAGFSMLEATPAFMDATPSKLYEYMAHGIPVVATPLPAQSALVREAGAGAIVADAQETAHLLQSWESDPEEVERLGAQGRRWASESSAFAEGSAVLARAVQDLVERVGAPGGGVS